MGLCETPLLPGHPACAVHVAEFPAGTDLLMLPHHFSSPGHVPGYLQARMGIRQVPADPASSNHSAQSQAGAGQALAVQKACVNSQKETKLTSYFDYNIPGLTLEALKGHWANVILQKLPGCSLLVLDTVRSLS